MFVSRLVIVLRLPSCDVGSRSLCDICQTMSLLFKGSSLEENSSAECERAVRTRGVLNTGTWVPHSNLGIINVPIKTLLLAF